MAKINFTEARVRDLKQSDKIAWYSHNGDAYPGLHLAVGQTTKTWYLKKRNPTTGKTQTINLGRYPAMSLELAGRRAKEIAAEVHNGTRGGAKMDTLSDAFEYHCKTKRAAKKLSEDTERSYRSIMKNMDGFMNRKLENISHVGLQEHLNTLAPATARLIRAIIGASYRAARKQRPMLINPAEGIELESAKKREPITETGDLATVWESILDIRSETRRMAWVVAMFTGIRHKSVVTLRWTPDPAGLAGHVDLVAKTIHLPKMKNRLARTLPIS
ncbi:MAG: integrase family protein, partial [Paracoccaceae bacterium]|nr:integrase family protein [Paracoccaceae bacterium]